MLGHDSCVMTLPFCSLGKHRFRSKCEIVILMYFCLITSNGPYFQIRWTNAELCLIGFKAYTPFEFV